MPPATALREGRTLTVDTSGLDDVVEVRAEDGALEIRVRLTVDGPVMEVEAAALRLRAKDSIDVECGGDFNLNAQGEVRVTGEMIHLN